MRPPLTAVMLGALAVGLPLMLLFEDTVTRIVGVIALFTFIVSGVFDIARPDLLGTDDDDGA